MKLRNLILAVIAGAALLTGCNKEVDLGPAKLEVNPTDVAFSQSVIATQDITLTATRDWAVTGLPDWIALSKESGPANTASQTITLSVTENKGNNRNATITFTIGFSRATLTVSQVGPEGEVDNGDGTKAKPFNVAGVIDYVTELGADVTSPKNVYVAGKISAISEAYTTQYGNGSFVISDDGETTGPQFTAYRVLYLGNKKFANGDTQIEVGDDVIVYGKVVNYKGNTPETSQNAAFLYSLNGVNKGGDGGGGGGESAEPQGKGTLDNPFNVAAAIVKAKETGETATEAEYYIKGKVAEVKEQFNAQYGNATFTMVDEGFSDTFTAFRVLYLENKKWALGGKELAVGDEVIVCAKIVNFKGNTPETSGGYVYSINAGGGGETPTVEPAGTGTEADPFNVAAAIAKAVETGETATTEGYYIKGKVAAVSLSAQYKNGDLDLVDVDGGEVFKAFRIKGFEGADITGDEPIAVGDEVVIYGNIVNYKGNTPETSQGGKLILWNGKTSFDGGDTPPSGDAGTAENPFTVEQAIAKAVEAGETATTEVYYIKGKVAAVSLSAQYKNADLDLIDEGKPEAIFKAFRIKGFDGADITGEEPIIIGDEVVVCGNIVNYKGNTPETTQGGKLVTWNGKTSFDGGDTPPSGDAGTAENPFTVEQAIAKAVEAGETATTDAFYIKGKVAAVSLSAQYKNADLDLIDEGKPEAIFKAFRIKGFNGADITGEEPIIIGDEVVVCGNIVNYKGNTPETTQGGTLILWNGKTSFDGGGDTPGGDTPGIMESNVTMITGTNAYDDGKLTVTYNGQTYTEVKNVKFGKGSAYGNGSIILPAGTMEIEFFAVGWKGADATLQFTIGETLKKVNVTANEGAANTSPYTMTVTDSDHYTVSLGTALATETTVKVETVADVNTGYRAFLFGVHANKTSSGGDTPGGDEPATPEHAGTAADPYTVNDAILAAGNADLTGKEYYVSAVVGKDISIKNGVASFELLDGTTDSPLSVVKAKSFEGAAFDGTEPLDWLDEVVLKGTVTTLAGSLPALTDGVLVLWNGKTSFVDPVTPTNDGLTPETAFTASEARTWVLANLTSGNNTGDTKYYVKGKMSKWVVSKNVEQSYTNCVSYGNASFYMTDDGSDNDNWFEAYQVYFLEGKKWVEGNPDLVVGDEVMVYGPLARYNDTPETQGKGAAYLYTLNGKTTIPHDGLTLATAFTPSEARTWVLANLTSGNNTGDTKYYVKGKMSKWVVSKNVEQSYTNCVSYGNASFYMTDDGTDNDNWFEAYQVNYLEGKKWQEGWTDVAVNDEVVVYGPLARYNDTPETQGKGAAYLYSLNGVTEVSATGGGDEPGGGDNPPAGGNDPIEFVFTSADPVTMSGVTVTCAKGEGSNNPAWNTNYNELRLYVKNTVTISSTANMAKVEYYWHKQGSKTWNSVSMTSSEGTYTDCEASTSATDSKKSTWEGTSKSIVLTMGDTSSAQRVLEKVVVTLAQ